MRKRDVALKVVILVVVLFNCPLVYGQEEFGTADKWDIEFTPYFWAAELDGDATLRGRTGPVEVSFSELLDNLDFAFMGRLEAWKGQWGLFVDSLFMDIGAEFSTPQGLVSADIDVKMTMLEFGLDAQFRGPILGLTILF